VAYLNIFSWHSSWIESGKRRNASEYLAIGRYSHLHRYSFLDTISEIKLWFIPSSYRLRFYSNVRCKYDTLCRERCGSCSVFKDTKGREDGGDMFLRNICNHLQDLTASKPRRPRSTYRSHTNNLFLNL
jgi:hypothetical protein